MSYWKQSLIFSLICTFVFITACGVEDSTDSDVAETESSEEFQLEVDRFADLRILRYEIGGWDNLSLQQKKLVYYLTQAGLVGRDITYDQYYRHNLEIRNALEDVYRAQHENESGEEWDALVVYLKRIWFSNGIHHHYASQKFTPGFSQDYLEGLMEDSGVSLSTDAMEAIFDESKDARKINLDPAKGLVEGSAVNFYSPDMTTQEAEEYYESIIDRSDKTPVSYGLNSKLVKKNGKVVEEVYKIGGLYSDALQEMVNWLGKAAEVAENKAQVDALKLLIEYYETGDLRKWDDYCVAWVQATDGDIDYNNGFIEVYDDPLGYVGAYETVVQIKDFEASERMNIIADHAQEFENESPIMDEHKKKEVVGITYNVVNVAGEAGSSSPSSPIGVNLPNSSWIRKAYGSKSISLGNLIYSYNNVDGAGFLDEFAYTDEEIDLAKKYGEIASNLTTAMHEVIGHASGKLEEGVGTSKETLKNYASPIEEARADLVALYYLPDEKLVEWGLLDSEDAYKAGYNSYIRNGLMLQLRRLEMGHDIEQAHMRNRQTVASWVYEKGKEDNVIEKIVEDGKTYFVINDYEKLRDLFGQLLREIQRITSQGDYEAGKNLIENYGVKVNQDIHKEVLERSATLDIPAYSGFLNPYLIPVTDENGEITDVKVEYGDSFIEQMLRYSDEYSFLK